MNKVLKKEKLLISFSGGRSSAVMTKLCLKKYKETHDIVVCFANTGCEDEETLKFVNRCDKEFGWDVVWIEANYTITEGVGVTSKVKSFETASREGEPMLWHIRKNGLPSKTNPSCSNRLKETAIKHYIEKRLNWPLHSYFTAIGLRVDEMRRVNAKYKERKFLYPLLDHGMNKDMVGIEMQSWPFDLMLKNDAHGNCKWCYKKSNRKLMTLYTEDPKAFQIPLAVEMKYQNYKHGKTDKVPFRRIFRGNKTARELILEAKKGGFEMYHDEIELQSDLFHPELDEGSSCSSSCESFE